MGCDGCVTYLSLEHPSGEGVGPVHSRKVPLPLTRDDFAAMAFDISGGQGAFQLSVPQPASISESESGGFLFWMEPLYAASHALAFFAKLVQ